MNPMHPELRSGLAEERIRRLAEDRHLPSPPGTARRLAARLLLVASNRLAGEPGSRVERVVHEPIGELVVLAPHCRVADVVEGAGESRGLERQLA
jgi:hypothetical protein